jgi:undecaprenyl diphosphate synthase
MDLDKQSTIPRHLGLILDGNRRWAKEQGLPTFEGHRKGYDNLRTILDYALDQGVQYVSAYVFSTENWQRTKLEVKYLMDLLLKMLTRDVQELHAKGIRIVWLGSERELSPKVRKAITAAVELTRDNTHGTFAICLNHGGHREVTEAVQRLVIDGVPAEQIDETKIASYLDVPELPPIDLIIRTSGEQRLSNFMLWRAAYSELLFTDTLWPAFTVAEFDTMLEQYAQRGRRFGK